MALTFLQATGDIANASTYTFAAQNLGTASSDRYIIVSAAARKAGASTTISSITIGGITATIVKQATNFITNTNVVGLAIALVPAGATGDIVVTFGGTMVRCAIGVWLATNISSITPVDTDSSTAADPTCALNVTTGGFAIGASGPLASTSTWTGLTERFDISVEASNIFTGASDTFAAAQHQLTITIDSTGAVEPVGVFASWSINTSNFF